MLEDKMKFLIGPKRPLDVRMAASSGMVAAAFLTWRVKNYFERNDWPWQDSFVRHATILAALAIIALIGAILALKERRSGFVILIVSAALILINHLVLSAITSHDPGPVYYERLFTFASSYNTLKMLSMIFILLSSYFSLKFLLRTRQGKESA